MQFIADLNVRRQKDRLGDRVSGSDFKVTADTMYIHLKEVGSDNPLVITISIKDLTEIMNANHSGLLKNF